MNIKILNNIDPHKVLINVPNANGLGGVSNYYKVLRNYFPENIKYFTVGKRGIEENIFNSFLRLINDFVRFKKEIKLNDYQVLLLNPSLDPKSIIRESIFFLLARNQVKKRVIFFRGWSESMVKKITSNKLWFKYFIKADAIITLSESSKEFLLDFGFKCPIFLETTVVDNYFYDENDSVDVNSNHEQILFMARIEKNKGIYEAVETFRILKRDFPELKMVIAGDGSELVNLKAYVKNAKILGISFPGYVSGKKKRQLLYESSIYFFPSFHDEGMPNSVLEAMAAGLPIVTRRVGGLNDFFEDGKMGFQTDSKDPAVFADLIKELLLNESNNKISNYNKKIAKHRFLASIVSFRLEKLFHEQI